MTQNNEEYQKTITKPNYVLICPRGEPRHFDDNLTGTCANCGCDIFFRPINKDATTKICIECALRPIDGVCS